MKTPLAWHNLLHNRVRTGVAIGGVTFAIVLMFMQLGFLEAVKATATMNYEALDFDICIRSRDYGYFSDPRSFPKLRLAAAEGMEGVASATPAYVGIFSWRNPVSKEPRAILAIGVPAGRPVFRDEAMQQRADAAWAQPRAILIDTQTRREFGPQNSVRFGTEDYGTHVEINGREFEITGHYTRGAGLTAGGAVLMKEQDFVQCAPYLPADEVCLGLVRVEKDFDAGEVAKRVASLLPDDVEVATREEVLESELNHWVWETNYGLIFQSGVLVAVIVGTAIVYQVLAADVASLMPEYATLKAIGYGNWHLVGILLQQSLLLALFSYVAGVAISQVLYEITSAGAQIPVRLTWTNLLLVLFLAVGMCVVSGIAAVRKAFRADPADLF